MTKLLAAWSEGDEAARDAVMELSYGELRRIAQARLGGAGGHTLNATGLAHEAYLRLVGQREVHWQNRAQFFALAARLMRRILIDRHRARNAQKRDHGERVMLSGSDLAAPVELDLQALTIALDRLARQDQRQAQIVELRFFAGLTIEEVAEVVELSPATVKREWALARAWLKRELDE